MSGISIGTQLTAPEGYLNLEAGITYHFLRSSPLTGRVLLLQLLERAVKEVTCKSEARPNRKVTPTPLPVVVALARSEFERGVQRLHIVKNEVQRHLPPWLAALEGLDLAVVDSCRRGAVISHSERVDDKLQQIFPLVQRFDEVLDSEDPDIVINRHARTLVPQVNETRLRLYFYTYIAFGRNRAVLHYPIHKIGHWNRMEVHSEVKRGRPHRKGKEHGYNTDAAMQKLMIAGYRAECGLGIKLSDIYVAVMRSKRFFGCKTRTIQQGKREYMELFHPQGKPFPTKKTFVYHVLNHFTAREVQKTLYGRVRARSKLLPTQGSFTEGAWNLMQRVERDAYAVAELPRGYVEGSALPPLYVVIKRDTASGGKTGIGFSQGAERASAYRMANFCEAIPKVKFCSLFGIEIRPEQWPMCGLSPADIQDRGAGSTRGGSSRVDDFRPIVNEMSPSHAGQSKALIETSNPKTASNDEAPNYVQSDLTSIELARKAIFELLLFNESCNVGGHIPPDMADAVSRPTPNGLWEALSALGRNDAVEMAFEDAVRAFLDQVDGVLSRDGVTVAGRLYRSEALVESKALDKVSGNQTIPVKVYVLEACIRHVWFDWERELIELDVRYPLPVNNRVLDMSLAEAVQYEEFTRRRDLDHEDHREAAMALVANAYEAATGLKWDSSRRVSGRPKRGGQLARQEAAEARHATSGRKAA